MRSSSTRPELYRVLWHPALSIVVGATSMLALMSLLARLIGLPGPRSITVLFVVLAPVVEAAIGNVLYSERAGYANRIRELVIFLLIFYTVLSLLRPGPVLERFVPSAEHLPPMLAAGITWLTAFRIHNRLRGREGLLRTFAGKHGDQLRHALIDRQHDMALTVRELRGTRASVALWFCLLCFVAILTATGLFTASDLPVASAAFILLAINAFVTAAAVAALNGFIDEYAANGDGLVVPFRFQRRRITAAAIVVGAALLLAFALSRNESLLPLDAILRLLRWFASLFDPGKRMVPQPLQRMPSPSNPYGPLLQELLPDGEPQLPPLWLRIVAVLLRRLALALAAGGATVLIFAPLFSPGFREGVRNLRPRALVRNLWERTTRRVTILTRWLRLWLKLFLAGDSGGRGFSEAARTVGESAAEPVGWRPGIRKRRQMDRVCSLFADLVEWGGRNGIAYGRNQAAREYLDMVRTLYPEHHARVLICAELFWRARYSQETLSRAEMREFLHAVRKITAAG